MKKCEGECGETRPLSFFYRNADTADGHEYRCRICAPRTRRPSASPEETAKRTLQDIKERYATDEAYRKRVRANQRFHLYGITSEQYDALLEAQGFACGACRRLPDGALHVDHDHRCCPGKKSCGKCIRGLLCFACNTTLGKVDEDADWLMALAAYLDSPPVVRLGVTIGGIARKVRRKVAECGTVSGYSKHIKDKTPIDDACREAKRLYDEEQRRKRGVKAHNSQHGTYGRAQKHRREGEPPCDDCLAAESTYQRERNEKKRLGVNPDWTPREVAACGTVSGYNRHNRLKEEFGEECGCRQANRDYQRDYRTRQKSGGADGEPFGVEALQDDVAEAAALG